MPCYNRDLICWYYHFVSYTVNLERYSIVDEPNTLPWLKWCNVWCSQVFVLRVTRPLWSGGKTFLSIEQVFLKFSLTNWSYGSIWTENQDIFVTSLLLLLFNIQQPIIVLISFHHFPLQLASQVDLAMSANPLTTHKIVKHYKMFTISYKHRVRTW